MRVRPTNEMPIVDTGGWAGSTTGIMTQVKLALGCGGRLSASRSATRELVRARGLAGARGRTIAAGRAAGPADRAAAADPARAPIVAAPAVLDVLHHVLSCESVDQSAASRERRRRSSREGRGENHSQCEHKLSHDVPSSCNVAHNCPAARRVCVLASYPAISSLGIWRTSTRLIPRCTRRPFSAERPFIQTISRSNLASQAVIFAGALLSMWASRRAVPAHHPGGM